MATPTSPTRPYLREADRRRQLLDATLRLVTRTGIESVTMSAVAREAGVSRRLVYDHFADQATLYDAFLEDRVQHYTSVFDTTIAASPDPVERAIAMFSRALSLPREELRIARMLVTGTGGTTLDRARARFRRHVLGRWFADDRPAPSDAVTATVWAMAAAVLTVADLEVRGEISHDAAVRVVTALVAGSTDRVHAT